MSRAPHLSSCSPPFVWKYSERLYPLHLTLLGDFVLNFDPSVLHYFQCYYRTGFSRLEAHGGHSNTGAGCCDKQRSCSGALLPENKHTPPSPRAGSCFQTCFNFNLSVSAGWDSHAMYFLKLCGWCPSPVNMNSRLQGNDEAHRHRGRQGKRQGLYLQYQECDLRVLNISINTDTLFQLYFFYQTHWGL